MSARHPRRSAISLAALALAAAALAAAAGAGAQLPGFPGSKPAPVATTPTPAPVPETVAEARARIEKLAEVARAERDRTPPAPPDGIAPSEQDARYEAVATLAYAYDGQLRSYTDCLLYTSPSPRD